MPYLDMADLENFVHLVQLFYAAHPHYQQENEKVRTHAGLPGEYFVSLPLARELAVWARERRFITRKDTARLLAFVDQVTAGIDPCTGRRL